MPRMRGHLPLLLLLIFPVAWASWSITVHPGVRETVVYGYADSPGCLVVGSGEVLRADVIVGPEVIPVDVNDYLCVPGNTAFQIVLRGYPLSFTVPEANVLGGSPLFPVYVSRVGGYTAVVVDARLWLLPAILGVLILLVAGVLAFLVLKKRRNSRLPVGYEGKEAAVLRYVAQHPGCTQKEVARALGLEKYQVSRILSRLEAEGTVVRVKKGISKRVFLPSPLKE